MLARTVLSALLAAVPVVAQVPASTPPMGWNSWDSYGLSVTEAEFKENASWLAHNLKRYGWEYAVVDEGWFLAEPASKQSGPPQVEDDGRYWPAANRFPSSAARVGFKPLAAWTHAQGLKFGIHIVRGIPREAVRRNLPIAGSTFRAADAADTSDVCPWNGDNFGVKNNAAGQAYYDAIARQYASWDIDFLKIDCISAHPYRAEEIRMVHKALLKTGRPIVLSLSPGPTPLDRAAEVRQEANLWRISDDIWDHWSADSAMKFSPPIKTQFETAAAWSKSAQPGHWPDADMLPIGYLGPRPGQGKARPSRLTHEEQQSVLTGWLIFRSPLVLGANLTRIDDWTRSLLTNQAAIDVNQHATDQHQALHEGDKVIWVSRAEGAPAFFIAVFNLGDEPAQFRYAWQAIGVSGVNGGVHDIWSARDLGQQSGVAVTLAPHASALYRVQ